MNSQHKISKVTQQVENIAPAQLICAFHKDKIITNFCSSLSCLLPMCPTCVSIHSQQHREQNTHGQFLRQNFSKLYHSIQQVIQSTSCLLLKTNKSLQDLSEQYTQDYWNKQKILESCKQTLNNQKKRLVRDIERKFQQIEHKLTRKINLFQDNLHDRYKQLEDEIQYLYDSLNKQREEFLTSNEKILKNIIIFYSQKKEDKIKEWLNKFRLDVDELKKQSIQIKLNQELFDLVKNIDYYFTIEQFKDQQNQYLIPTGKQLISSNTKRKGHQSPRWTQDKQNFITVRTNTNKNNQNAERSHVSLINQSNICNSQNQGQWSARKF